MKPADIVIAVVFGEVFVLVYTVRSHIYLFLFWSKGEIFDNRIVAIGRHVLLIVKSENVLGCATDRLYRIVLVMGAVSHHHHVHIVILSHDIV